MLVTEEATNVAAVPDVGRASQPVIAAASAAEVAESATGLETRPTEEVAAEVPPPHPNFLPEAESARIDWQLAAREAVAAAVHLPPAVRAHFTRSIEDSKDALCDALGRPLIPVADAVAALASALPKNWITDPAALQQLHHPAGEGFFDVSADALSDERAAQIVRQQFASTGYLKPEATS